MERRKKEKAKRKDSAFFPSCFLLVAFMLFVYFVKNWRKIG